MQQVSCRLLRRWRVAPNCGPLVDAADFPRTGVRAQAQSLGGSCLAAQLVADILGYRRECAHEREHPFRILNILEVIGQSMGIT